MGRDIFCRLTKLDGSIVETWLPESQVAIMTDLDHPQRMSIFEVLDIVSIEAEESVENERQHPLRQTA